MKNSILIASFIVALVSLTSCTADAIPTDETVINKEIKSDSIQTLDHGDVDKGKEKV
jgi:hypothetical protein